MENEITIVNSTSLIEQTTSNALIEKSKAFNEFKEFLKNDLKDGVDFGKIPSVEKPCLFKAGGEKIQLYLGLTPQYKLLHREFVPNQVRKDKVWNDVTKKYQEVETVRNYYCWEWSCELWHGSVKVAEGVGMGNTEEDKYVSQYKGAKTPDSLANTVMKISKKRAFMDAIIGVSGVSDIFTQDLEDSEMVNKLKVDKTTKVNKLTKDNITLNTEINELKEKVANFETDYRKQKIVYESSISNLKNEKVSLELKLKNVTNDSSGNVVNNNDNEYEDKIKKLNAFIENQKIQIKHLNEIIISKDKIFETINSNSSNATNSDTIEQLQNKLLEDSRTINKLKQEINEKNNQIALITDNHQNDLNELNTSIILLKSKIAKLQEENISLSYSQRSQA